MAVSAAAAAAAVVWDLVRCWPPLPLFCPHAPRLAPPTHRTAEGGPQLDLLQLTEALAARGVHAPLCFRFLPIVGHRIDKLNVGAGRAGWDCWVAGGAGWGTGQWQD